MKKQGFTLLEVMIAIAILATSLILLVNSWSASTMRIRKTQNAFEISALLERKMTEIEIEYGGKSLEEIPDEKSGEFEGVDNFSWKMASKKLEVPDIASTLTAQDGGADQMMMTVVKQLTESISKSVKEVTVTVTYTGASKPIEHSVTTYFVDFNKEIPLGIPGG
jgi:general secretion pathway protein I